MSTKHTQTLEELTPYGKYAYKLFQELCSKYPNATFQFSHFTMDIQGTKDIEEWVNIYSELEDDEDMDDRYEYEKSTHEFFKKERNDFKVGNVKHVYAYFGGKQQNTIQNSDEVILATQNI
ncbi:hypothetical protein MA9V2_148 [Chryseobacterium phage MA9V-2]|nr:hypothetical protein MA9V2_148 [Chryseobacterium phage MA9V-2]